MSTPEPHGRRLRRGRLRFLRSLGWFHKILGRHQPFATSVACRCVLHKFHERIFLNARMLELRHSSS